MSGFWLCSTTEGVTCHLDQAAAEAEAARKKAPAVAWFCSDFEDAGVAAGAAVCVPVGDSRGGVALGSTGIALSPQNAAQGVARVVERAMGHLGLRTGEIA